MLDVNTCEEAMRRRDAAFDGMFFVGVKTTGIYCRPVCRVRMPLFKNVLFYPTAAAAEGAGFRPCLRCRPETAPFCPEWKGSQGVVERAIRLIETGALDRGSVAALAERLGIGVRQLNRLFGEYFWASPAQFAKTVRAQRAKRLLDVSNLPVAEIASQAGFASPRRMNATFNELYGLSPSALRANGGNSRAKLAPNVVAPSHRY